MYRIASRTPLLVLATAATCVLLAMAGAWALTYEPAPAIRVRWRDGLSSERRSELERRFLLVRPVPHEAKTLTYDLLDTSRSNIEALLGSPEVEDTDHINRADAMVPFDAPYGESWMWIGHRTPVLRTRGVVETMTVASALVLAGSLLVARPLKGPRLRQLLRRTIRNLLHLLRLRP